MPAAAMRHLSTDDRETLLTRLVLRQISAIKANPPAIADLYLHGHRGYDNMSDEGLLETAIKQNVSLSGLEIAESSSASSSRY